MSIGNCPESLPADSPVSQEMVLWRSRRTRFLCAIWTSNAVLALAGTAVSIWSHPRHHFAIVIALCAAVLAPCVFFALRASARHYELTPNLLRCFDDDSMTLDRSLDDLLCVIVSFRGMRRWLGGTDIRIGTPAGTILLERVDNWRGAVDAIRLGLNARGCDLEPFHYTDSARMFVPTRGSARESFSADDVSSEVDSLERMWNISDPEADQAISKTYVIAPLLAIAFAAAGVVYSAVHHGDPDDSARGTVSKLAQTTLALSAEAAAPPSKPFVHASGATERPAGAYNQQHSTGRCSSCHANTLQTGTK